MADSKNLPPATTTPLTFKKQVEATEITETQDLKNQATGAHRYITLTSGDDKNELERMITNVKQIILYCQENNINGADRWATVKENL